jgi:sugar lactone lactonase YvrE
MPFLIVCVALSLQAQAPSLITTAAGTGVEGDAGDDGLAAEARLNMPFDVAFDTRGNLYFSDTFNHRIRRVDGRSGVITTVAGDGTKGFSGDGGPATRARLNEPYGVAVDTGGNVFIVDRLNGRIRRVDGHSGNITTVAGNGTSRFSGDGGAAVAAGLVEPNGLALDQSGRKLFIADVAGHRIRLVDMDKGLISTFAGTGRARHTGDGGPAAAASIYGARAVDVGPDGTVFILEREGNRLRAVDPRTGVITTRAGTGAKGFSGDGGPALSATFNGPKELAVDPQANILIVDTENHAIRRIDGQSGVITTVAGSGRKGSDGDGGPAVAAKLDRPHGVAVGPDGAIYIGDTGNHRIRKVSR